MATTLPARSAYPGEEEQRFEVLGDLVSTGRLGSSRVVVTQDQVLRLETTPLGEEVVASYTLADLKDPRIEDLVDALALSVEAEFIWADRVLRDCAAQYGGCGKHTGKAGQGLAARETKLKHCRLSLLRPRCASFVA